MRIRAVRPDFWSDDTIGQLSDSVRLFYVGLWCVADDAGWLEWKPSQLGATLYPYRPMVSRERNVEAWGIALETAGRLVRYPCGCAHIPTLAKHQRLGGTPTYQYRDKHRRHMNATSESGEVRSSPSGRVGEGKVGKGGKVARPREAAAGAPVEDWEQKVVEMRVHGEARA